MKETSKMEGWPEVERWRKLDAKGDTDDFYWKSIVQQMVKAEVERQTRQAQEDEVDWRKVVKEWFAETSNHGFNNILKTRSMLIRLLWIVILTGSITYCFYSIVLSMISFLSYGVTVSYATYVEAPTDFPAVSICNLNPIDFTGGEFAGEYTITSLIDEGIDPWFTLASDETAIGAVTKLETAIRAIYTADLNETYMKMLSFNLSTMLVSCNYNGVACSVNDFEWFRTFDYGNCYVFNSVRSGRLSKPRRTSKFGPGSGLRLELFVGIKEYDFYTIRRGAYLAVHNNSAVPIVKYEGVMLPTGQASNIAVSRTFYTKLSSPYSDCRNDVSTAKPEDSRYFRETLSINIYSQRLCLELAFQTIYVKANCNCSDPTVPETPNRGAVCKTTEELACVKNQRDLLDSGEESKLIKYCPLECNSISYDTRINSASYPTNYYAYVLSTQNSLVEKFRPTYSYNSSSEDAPPTYAPSIINEQSLTTGTLMVSVFYEDLRYTAISDVPAIPFETFLGIIGGQFGLFMGASYLSFIEILEMVYNVVASLIKMKRKRQVNNSTVNVSTP